jgi:hypothetical protein
VVLRSAIDKRWLTPKRRALAEAMRRQAEGAVEDSDLYLEDDFLKLSDVSLPPEVMAMRGRTLQVVQAPSEGASTPTPPCEARIAGIEIHNSATESFESTRGARGLDHLYGTFVLGRFERPCPNALWASEQEPPTQHLPYKPDAALAAQVTQAVLRHPAYKKLQAAFASSGGKTVWDAKPEGKRSQQAFDAPAGEQLVVFSAYRGGGSDDFTGSLDVLCSVDANGVVRVRGILGHDDDGVLPRVAVDLDSDGRLEILSGPTGADNAIEVLSFTESTAVRTPVYFAPNFVCPG